MERAEPRRSGARVGARRVKPVAHEHGAAPGVAAALELDVPQREGGGDVRRAAARHRQHAPHELRHGHIFVQTRHCASLVGEEHHGEVAGAQVERQHGGGHRGQRHLLAGHAERGVDHEHDLMTAFLAALHDQVAGLRERLAEHVAQGRLDVEARRRRARAGARGPCAWRRAGGRPAA